MHKSQNNKHYSLLSGNTKCLTASTGRLCSLSSDSGTPKMSETSMIFGFSKSLEIFSHHGSKLIGDKVGPGSKFWIFLSIEEPLWNVVLGWSSEDVGD